MKVATIIVGNEQKGFFFGLGKEMAADYAIHFIVDNPIVKRLLNDQALGVDFKVTVMPDRRQWKVAEEGIVEKAALIEDRYGVKLAYLMGQDRAWGFGYLTNIEKYPTIRRAFWARKTKIQHVADELEFLENSLTNSDLVISQYPTTVLAVVCDRLGISHYHPTPIKFGNRYFWSDDSYQGSRSYFREIDENLKNPSKLSALDNSKYEVDAGGKLINSLSEYSIWSAIKKAFKLVMRDAFNSILRRRKRNGYRVFGWVPSIFRKGAHYRFVRKHSSKVAELNGEKFVYFPLHMEPEVSLLQFSPENTNTIESIIWISKNLPVDRLLVVKEQANVFAVRSRRFYERLISMPNVILACPDSNSWDWIKNADFVATISGTTGQEAVHFTKPVMTFSPHHVINRLPTVFFVQSFYDVKNAIDQLASSPPSIESLQRSRDALSAAQLSCSFEMREYKHSYKSSKPMFAEVRRARDALYAILRSSSDQC